PYAVAQLRLTQRLREFGIQDQNPLVYLADTLESPHRQPRFPDAAFYESLTREHDRAREVKRMAPILVCLGNPPYDREQHGPDAAVERRKGGWVRYGDEDEEASPLLEEFLDPVRASRQGVHLKNLYNDYVYFWRWALWKVLDNSAGPGIVTFITASSYLRGPAFAGMREKMRRVFDELWIIDLEGDSLGARKTENVFAIRTPVAIAIGVREGEPDPDRPARVWKVRLTGTEQEKLAELDSKAMLSDFEWRECSAEWSEPFVPNQAGGFFDWPAVTEMFPWQHSGVQFKRTWPIGETPEVLEDRWRALLEHAPEGRGTMFRETRDRKVDKSYPSLLGAGNDPPLAALDSNAKPPQVVPYAYRSLDRQFILRDARLGDFCRPALHRAHGEQQTYITSLLTGTLGSGPACMAAGAIPDLHHFRGSFGGRDVIPLYRDAATAAPNVTKGLLSHIGGVHGVELTAERLFAYVYGILAQPAYVERFWDELETPPPRLPITKNRVLFDSVADLGERLLHLHTHGERFFGPERPRRAIPNGEARNTREVPPTPLPEGHTYDAARQVLRVGVGDDAGEFGPVSPEVYGYSVSGLHIVKAWLDRRSGSGAGRKSSQLDQIRPDRWDFAGELLQLLWILEETVRLRPEGDALLTEVCSSPLFTSSDLLTSNGEQELSSEGSRSLFSI
ncbi:MAG: DNA methyltransferase, partial [Chloroflexi bacterium]|nr:DNA methyltransferase [Chloroflexota bacterium]